MAAKKRPSAKPTKSASKQPAVAAKPRKKVTASRTKTAAAQKGTSLLGKKSAPAARPAASTKRSAQAAAPGAAVSKRAPAKQALSKQAPAKQARPTAAGKSSPKPPGAGEAAALGEGDRAPSFELEDYRGGTLSSKDLGGQAYVLYFYPKDDTPGCTTQACGFRDAAAPFDRAGVRVIGVSPDSIASHQKFSAKYQLPFSLLSDVEQQLATAYGAWALKKNYGREYMGVVRSTFLINADGVIVKAWRGVRVNGHVAAVQAAAEQLS